MARRRGRRPGTTDTRDAILAAAGEAFAHKGYDRATIRAIAAAAAVDPALVYHHFGSKEQLILAVMNVPVDLDVMTQEILNAPRAEVGAHLVRVILDICDSPAGTAVLAQLRSGMNNEWNAQQPGEFIAIPLIRRVMAGLEVGREQTSMRAGMVIAEIMGLVVIRYILKLEPSASAAPDKLIAAIGPTLHHYLTDDLPGVFEPAGSGRRLPPG
ncbi:TetR family transcriptional regulator [Amycolatopsis sp. lyj-109]|uniref:TetR/AcrR family transcriptional regulator n=1 Tax=Amycolatopsis sp. lyj-109 TaxID=2789287 RepID=UPI00397DD002